MKQQQQQQQKRNVKEKDKKIYKVITDSAHSAALYFFGHIKDIAITMFITYCS